MKGFARMLNSAHLSHKLRPAASAAVEHFHRNSWLDDAASVYCKTNREGERERGKKKRAI